MKCELCGKRITKNQIQQHVFGHGIDFGVDWIANHIDHLIERKLLPYNAQDELFHLDKLKQLFCDMVFGDDLE